MINEKNKMINEKDMTLNQDYVHIDVNPVIITSDNKIILAKRKSEVFEGNRWHLPGGRLLVGETIINCLKRIVLAKTGLEIELNKNSIPESFIGIYDDPNRDTREHVLALAFLCKIAGGVIRPGFNVKEVKSFYYKDISDLDIAFDHTEIINDSIAKYKI